jgi:hypothetical protein
MYNKLLAVKNCDAKLFGQRSYLGLRVNCLLFMSAFKQNWSVSTNLSKNPKYEILTQIVPVGITLLRVDGRTDGSDEANSRFTQLLCRRLYSNQEHCVHLMSFT